MYQSSNPLIPFMYKDITIILESILRLILKESKVINISLHKIKKLDLHHDKDLYKAAPDIGCGGSNLLSKLRRENCIDDKAIYDFYQQCRDFIIKIVDKISERMLIGISFLKSATSLSPESIIDLGNAVCEQRFMALVRLLSSQNIISHREGDASCQEYRRVLSSPLNIQKFRSFKRAEQRLDDLFFNIIDVPADSSLSKVIQCICVMSNSQCEVENGNSINKSMLEANMGEMTIISKRIIKNHMHVHRLLPHEVEIDQPLMTSVSFARSKYVFYLENQRKEKVVSEKDKEKLELDAKIKELMKERQDSSEVMKGLEEKVVLAYKEAALENNDIKRQEKVLIAKGMENQSKNLGKRMLCLDEEVEVLQKKKKLMRICPNMVLVVILVNSFSCYFV